MFTSDYSCKLLFTTVYRGINRGKQREITKTVSARVSEKVHEKILNRCNIQGCTVNEFLTAAIEFVIVGHVDFEFGEPEDDRLGAIEYERHSLGQAQTS